MFSIGDQIQEQSTTKINSEIANINPKVVCYFGNEIQYSQSHIQITEKVTKSI